MLYFTHAVFIYCICYKKYFLSQAEKQLELSLFRLFHNEREIEEITKDMEKQQGVVARVERNKEEKEEELKEKKKEGGKVSKEMANLDQDIREIVSFSCGISELGSTYVYVPLTLCQGRHCAQVEADQFPLQK